MRLRIALATGSLVLATAMQGQQPGQQPFRPTPVPEATMVIYRVDLNPTGSAFAMNEPVLEGEEWVFRTIPDRQVTRVKKERVKKVSRWTRDFDKEVVYQVDADPVGVVLAADEPVKKGNTYVFHTWKEGTYISVRATDVRKVTRLTGMEAFKAEEIELGVFQLKGDVHINPEAFQNPPPVSQGAAPTGAPGQSSDSTNQGIPVRSDGYAPPPASGTVARPGDVPMTPNPAPPPR